MARTQDCVFCRIVAGDLPCLTLYEDDDTLAMMDINPGNEGHALVIPKAHHANLFELPDDALAACARTARRVASAVQSALAPDGLNLVQANGAGAGQSVFHFHIHVLPRRAGDDLRMNWGHTPGDMEAVKAAHQRILEAADWP